LFCRGGRGGGGGAPAASLARNPVTTLTGSDVFVIGASSSKSEQIVVTVSNEKATQFQSRQQSSAQSLAVLFAAIATRSNDPFLLVPVSVPGGGRGSLLPRTLRARRVKVADQASAAAAAAAVGKDVDVDLVHADRRCETEQVSCFQRTSSSRRFGSRTQASAVGKSPLEKQRWQHAALSGVSTLANAAGSMNGGKWRWEGREGAGGREKRVMGGWQLAAHDVSLVLNLGASRSWRWRRSTPRGWSWPIWWLLLLLTLAET
jgi:hypothetical protein